MNTPIHQRIINFLKPVSQGLTVADVRLGLIYTSVRLNNGNIGIAWTGRVRDDHCSREPQAGTLAGRPAEALLNMLASDDSALHRTIGLAAANALAAGMPRPETTSVEILKLINMQPSDHVVMAGFFGPLIPRLRQTGCRLDILELRDDIPGAMSPDEGGPCLAACSVAIITATSVVTGTLDELLAGLGEPRAVVILGPSSFMRPEVFDPTPATHIAGGWIRDASAVERIVSEGGGTRTLKPYMDFETICLKPSKS